MLYECDNGKFINTEQITYIYIYYHRPHNAVPEYEPDENQPIWYAEATVKSINGDQETFGSDTMILFSNDTRENILSRVRQLARVVNK